MKKSHRVAHENQRRGGFCYYYYTILSSIVKNAFENPSSSRNNTVTIRHTTAKIQAEPSIQRSGLDSYFTEEWDLSAHYSPNTAL